MRKRRRLLIVSALAVLLILIGGRAASGLYVEALWFSHLDYGRFFWTLRLYHWAVTAIFALLAGGFLFGNLYPLARATPRLQIRRRYGDIEIAELFPGSYLILGAIALAVIFGLGLGLYVSRRWTLSFIQLLNAPAWGETDPFLSQDLGVYVFRLPVLSALHVFAILTILGTTVFVLVAHLVSGGINFVEGRPVISGFARRHVSVLLVLGLLLVAAGYWLGVQEMVWSGGGPTGGLGYTDVSARYFGHRILVGFGLLAAAGTVYGAYRADLRYGVGGLVLVLLGVILVDQVYPTVIQNLRVEPNELDRERPYLRWNMSFTRSGFGLHRFEEREFPLDLTRSPGDSALARATAGLPLWDPRPLRATYNQFQGINPYFTFVDVDYDRYGEPGAIGQVAVAVREIDIAQLPREARTWQNLHLSDTYTHGLGLVISPAATITIAGEPGYYVSGIPPSVSPEAPADIRLEWPDVFFGEMTGRYVLVRADEETQVGPRPRGVSLDAFHRKLSFAWTLGDRNLLLSQELRPGTRILYHRLVRDRVARLAPFLSLDPEIYPVLTNGRVVWVQDAYTVTPYYALSQRVRNDWGEFNYVRNSVKITVDAVTGETRLYVADEDDPLLASYRSAFPSLFRPLAAMPEDIRRHLRYPRTLLMVQAGVLRAYHVDDPRALYHQLDLWDLPVERYREGEERVQPYYVVMPDPAGYVEGLGYLLVLPFTARGRDNMRGLLLARSDVTRQPRVTLYRLPSEQVLGPRQVEVQIDQDPVISQQFTLWQQRGSRVIRGHLLVVPAGGTFVYVEPIFLEAESGGAAPSLKRVVVALDGRVAMGETLDGALAALLAPGAGSGSVQRIRTGAGESVRLQELRSLVARADSALRNGDLGAFGRLWAEIRRWAETATSGPER